MKKHIIIWNNGTKLHKETYKIISLFRKENKKGPTLKAPSIFNNVINYGFLSHHSLVEALSPLGVELSPFSKTIAALTCFALVLYSVVQ